MKRFKLVFGVVASVVLLASCATNKDAFAPLEKNVQATKYQAALDAIDKAQAPDSKEPLYEKNNGISQSLDKGFLENYATQYPASTKDFKAANQAIISRFPRSCNAPVYLGWTGSICWKYPQKPARRGRYSRGSPGRFSRYTRRWVRLR
jgi:hypothetical protein